jgi:hypothetical protein
LDHPAFLIAGFAGAVHHHFDLISKKFKSEETENGLQQSKRRTQMEKMEGT